MSKQRCFLTSQHNHTSVVTRTDNNRTHNVCSECCYGDLCNAAGCGTDGFPKQRGPVCFNCPQSRDPADCDVISVCHQGQVCHVEEIYEFGDVFYKTSCVQNTDQQCVSPPVFNPVEIGKRSTTQGNCFSCCSDDFCNTKCNVTTTAVPSTTPFSSLAPNDNGFQGKEFFLMFMRNFMYNYDSNLSAIVTFFAPDAQIKLTTAYNSTSYNVSGPTKHIDIDANMTMRENGKSSKGIILTSNTPVSVSASSLTRCCLSEDYMTLPIESLGSSYIVGTSKPSHDFGSSFAVGSPFDNTVVNITLSSSGVYGLGQYQKEGNEMTVVLDRLDTFYVQTQNDDLTGTRIESDKPVAVVSGNRCTFGFEFCNYVVEYLPPVSTWGFRFMVPPIKSTKRGYQGLGRIRIVSSVNNTNVKIRYQDIFSIATKTYRISTFLDIDTIPTKAYTISSDQPVLVLLFPIRQSIGMTLVPSINQFSHGPVLVSPPNVTSSFDNYIAVTIRTNDEAGLQLLAVNGTDLPNFGSLNFPDADGEIYSFITVSCNNTKTCVVQHTDNNVAFSVIVYGFRKPFEKRKASETYAYPGNLKL
ncbi:IgGFc-binding protein-like isoform X2 [Mizuhopecten yessoensis]|nr:IgGFc-binding protein-like isoform X2 [Mizuhopecten yessoensis]